jgi:salicylate hydroxylase
VAAHKDFLPQVQVIDRKIGLTKSLEGDLIIAADGIRSTLRKQMAKVGNYTDQLVPTGDAAFRLLIHRESVKHDQELLSMLDSNIAVRYMGPGGHVMAYPLKRNLLYNIVLLHPATTEPEMEDEDIWTTRSDRAKLVGLYESWSPMVRSWVNHADVEVIKWPLKTLEPLPHWVRGSVALAGDACHPMLPYVAQGASNGIEDAAVLATAFTCTDNVSLALGVYEVVRKQRAERIAASAAATGRTLHLSDGAEQRERDNKIRNAARGVSDGDDWRDTQWQDYVWGTDVMRVTIDQWEEMADQVRNSQSQKR